MPQETLTDSFVARTEQHRERWAAENVFRAGYKFYLPQLRKSVRLTHNGVRRREFRTEPLFPGYLFVSAESGQWHELLTLFGVVGLVTSSENYPAIIRVNALLRVKAMEGADGAIVLPKAVEGSPFTHGRTARIIQGSYTGYQGIVQGTSANDRVQVLLDYMGRRVPFIVREANLELVA